MQALTLINWHQCIAFDPDGSRLAKEALELGSSSSRMRRELQPEPGSDVSDPRGISPDDIPVVPAPDPTTENVNGTG